MKNFAEFQILGRVGKIKQFDGKVNVTVCANYPTKKDSETRENPHWNEVSIFSEAVRDYADEIRQGRRPGSGPGTHEAEQFRAQRREGLHGRSYRGGLLNSRVEKPEGDRGFRAAQARQEARAHPEVTRAGRHRSRPFPNLSQQDRGARAHLADFAAGAAFVAFRRRLHQRLRIKFETPRAKRTFEHHPDLALA